MKTTIFLLLVVFSTGYSDDIYLKSGIVVRNVKVNDSTDTHLNIVRDGKPTTILLQAIERIEIKSLDPSQVARYERFRSGNISKDIEANSSYDSPKKTQNPKVEYPNLKLLPVSFICFGLAWDYLSSTSDLNKVIDAAKSAHLDTSELESQRNRKSIVGVVFITAGILNTIISFQSVEIRVQTTSLSLKYSF